MKDFRRLTVWQKSHSLALAVYSATAGFPPKELYGLTSQLRRACVSIAANIAEGCGRGTSQDFGRFLQMAMGSASEVEYELLLARDLRYLGDAAHQTLSAQTSEIQRMLSALIRKTQSEHRVKAVRNSPANR